MCVSSIVTAGKISFSSVRDYILFWHRTGYNYVQQVDEVMVPVSIGFNVRWVDHLGRALTKTVRNDLVIGLVDGEWFSFFFVEFVRDCV